MKILLVLVLLVSMLLVAMPAIAEKLNVSIGGHTFTADLPDGWTVSKTMTIVSIGPEDSDWAGSWTGMYVEAFDYPAFPNAPKNSDYYWKSAGSVYLYVVKIPADLRESVQEHDIAVYGSPDKIPDDQKAQELNKILTGAAHISLISQSYDSEKDITFNDHKAHLSEGDNRAWSTGSIAILLDDNTVAIIQPAIQTSTMGQQDFALYNGRAWDIINSIVVS